VLEFSLVENHFERSISNYSVGLSYLLLNFRSFLNNLTDLPTRLSISIRDTLALTTDVVLAPESQNWLLETLADSLNSMPGTEESPDNSGIVAGVSAARDDIPKCLVKCEVVLEVVHGPHETDFDA
jgi:hypothetical protein